MEPLEIYQKAINKIADYFEYRNESVKDRLKVQEILSELTNNLRKHYEANRITWGGEV
jgi:hypothetical protein